MNPIPEINKVGLGDWDLFFYTEFNDLFLQEGEKLDEGLIEELRFFREKELGDFRTQLVFKSISFLIGVFSAKKEIRFYTPKLNQELFIIHHHEAFFKDNKRFLNLKVHTEKAATLSFLNCPSEIELITQKFKLPDFLEHEKFKNLEGPHKALVQKLLGLINGYRPSFFEKISDFGLSLSADYSLIRIHLLKFLAILPSLDFDRSGKEVKRILLESIRRLLTDNQKEERAGGKGQNRPLPAWFIILLLPLYFLARCACGDLTFRSDGCLRAVPLVFR